MKHRQSFVTRAPIVFFLFLSLFFFMVNVDAKSDECPIGTLSYDRLKCYFALSTMNNFFDAEYDCKKRAQNANIEIDSAELVSISNAIENENIRGLNESFVLEQKLYILA